MLLLITNILNANSISPFLLFNSKSQVPLVSSSNIISTPVILYRFYLPAGQSSVVSICSLGHTSLHAFGSCWLVLHWLSDPMTLMFATWKVGHSTTVKLHSVCLPAHACMHSKRLIKVISCVHITYNIALNLILTVAVPVASYILLTSLQHDIVHSMIFWAFQEKSFLLYNVGKRPFLYSMCSAFCTCAQLTVIMLTKVRGHVIIWALVSYLVGNLTWQ